MIKFQSNITLFSEAWLEDISSFCWTFLGVGLLWGLPPDPVLHASLLLKPFQRDAWGMPSLCDKYKWYSLFTFPGLLEGKESMAFFLPSHAWSCPLDLSWVLRGSPALSCPLWWNWKGKKTVNTQLSCEGFSTRKKSLPITLNLEFYHFHI